jgi:hypothetical protein
MTGIPWDQYARLQAELRDNPTVGDRAWGTEAGLNRILAGEFADSPTIDADIKRAVASEQRRDRHRAALRRRYLLPLDDSPHPEIQLFARAGLRSARARTTDMDWRLLFGVGEGHEYAELAVARQTTNGALRAQVFRLRRKIA